MSWSHALSVSGSHLYSNIVPQSLSFVLEKRSTSLVLVLIGGKTSKKRLKVNHQGSEVHHFCRIPRLNSAFCTAVTTPSRQSISPMMNITGVSMGIICSLSQKENLRKCKWLWFLFSQAGGQRSGCFVQAGIYVNIAT